MNYVDGMRSKPVAWMQAIKSEAEELRREAQCAALVEDSEKHRAWVLDQFEAVKELAPPSDLSPFSFEAFERASPGRRRLAWPGSPQQGAGRGGSSSVEPRVRGGGRQSGASSSPSPRG